MSSSLALDGLYRAGARTSPVPPGRRPPGGLEDARRGRADGGRRLRDEYVFPLVSSRRMGRVSTVSTMHGRFRPCERARVDHDCRAQPQRRAHVADPALAAELQHEPLAGSRRPQRDDLEVRLADRGRVVGPRPANSTTLQSGRPDLNRGPLRPERSALPGCATPRCEVIISRRPGNRPVVANGKAGDERLQG